MRSFVILDSLGSVVKAGQYDDATPLDQQVTNPGDTAYDVPAGVVSYQALDPEPLRPFLWEKVKAKRDLVIDGGAQTPIGVVDSDLLSRTNITGAAFGAFLAKSASQPFSIEWTAKDNSIHSLDADGMIALGVAVMHHTSAAHDTARTLRTAIEAGADVPTLLLIDISSGWPT